MKHISQIALRKEARRHHLRITEHGRDSREGAYEAWTSVRLPYENDIQITNLNTGECGTRSFRTVWRNCFMPNS